MAPQQKIGARPTGTEASASEAAPAKGSKKKFIIIGAGVGVVALVAAYWFLAGPGKAAPAATEGAAVTAPAEPEYELGEILVIEPISINLEGGHYLRLGLGLQLIAKVHAVPDTAKALDAAIALYAGHTTEELSDLAFREELKVELGEILKEVYHEEVVGVYYTDFVTQ
ncbi:MAG: flagellar basal body-associated FliL family protein [Demequinaceae bacterium]|nr:flagellar basal body-associated FliL family protein [Demequinaceae bacterium]